MLTCMVGGVIILITALVVWRLIPKGLKITEDATDEVAIPESYQLEDKKVLQLEEGTKRSDEERTFQLQEGAKRPEREEIQEEVKDYSTDELFISDVKVDVSSTKAMMKKVGVEVVRVPLDSESVSILEDACTKAGIDLTTAFIIFAKKVVQEKHLPWESCD